jgi:hypothetical protein
MENNMSDEVQAKPAETPEDGPQTPQDFLSKFKGAPDEDLIAKIKSSSPGGRLRMITSTDGQRVYILRAISAFELQQLQDGILKTVLPEKYPTALKTALAVKCVVWTSATPTGVLTDLELKSAGAGLVDTLHEVISELSDYMEAPQIRQFSADL